MLPVLSIVEAVLSGSDSRWLRHETSAISLQQLLNVLEVVLLFYLYIIIYTLFIYLTYYLFLFLLLLYYYLCMQTDS
jgi:hypothetical protein